MKGFVIKGNIISICADIMKRNLSPNSLQCKIQPLREVQTGIGALGFLHQR